ncbi:MAG: ribonuclease III [Nanoarchaeota archaeon]|nr:ribonuclease III [Nanoarchaeota archaeon]
MPEPKNRELEKKLGIPFKNKALLQEALTHRSYLNENTKWETPHNERLEYLGDAVLELIVTSALFRNFPSKQEGDMTSIRAALVNHIMLAKVAGELGFEGYILLSRGEARENGRAKEAILANTVEALIGAIYIDQGYDKAEKFVRARILSHLDEVLEKELFLDPKSTLQEIVQEKLKVTPTYKVLDEKGPDHEKEFVVGVFFDKEKIAEGKGFSKQDAERAAAANALKNWKK